ncbi:hypothetical protein TNCV_3741651 [Trichonephila clavipes]|nr:hypothetical protein TNCV_3741651 [Trichonephila clavipes]
MKFIVIALGFPPNVDIRKGLINQASFSSFTYDPTLGSGRRSLVVKITDSWPVCHELEPSTAEEPPCRGAMHVKSVAVQMSSRWCGS